MREKIIERLENGEFVTNYKESGHSMEPKIKHRQPITLAPPHKGMVAPGDIVFCKVKGNYYTHLVLAEDDSTNQVLIGNNKGGVNGWTPRKNIYGIVVAVEDRWINSAMNKVRINFFGKD
jgi:hypothetical protein